MLAEDQPRIGHRRIQADAHAARLAALLLRLPGLRHARAQRAARRVQPAGDHRRALRQARERRGLRRHPAHDLVARAHRRQQLRRHLQRPGQIQIPAAAAHVKARQPIALRRILRALARQPAHDIAVGLQHRRRARHCLRRVALVPADLGQRIARAQRIAAARKQCLRPGQPLHLRALLARARIRPDGRGQQRLALRIHRDRGPALSVYAHAGHLARARARRIQRLARGRARRAPPVRRVLLGPARLRMARGIPARRLRDGAPIRRKQRRFERRGAHVDAQQVRHQALPALPHTPISSATRARTASRPAERYPFGSNAAPCAARYARTAAVNAARRSVA